MSCEVGGIATEARNAERVRKLACLMGISESELVNRFVEGALNRLELATTGISPHLPAIVEATTYPDQAEAEAAAHRVQGAGLALGLCMSFAGGQVMVNPRAGDLQRGIEAVSERLRLAEEATAAFGQAGAEAPGRPFVADEQRWRRHCAQAARDSLQAIQTELRRLGSVAERPRQSAA